jgi:hypothetical protein
VRSTTPCRALAFDVAAIRLRRARRRVRSQPPARQRCPPACHRAGTAAWGSPPSQLAREPPRSARAAHTMRQPARRRPPPPALVGDWRLACDDDDGRGSADRGGTSTWWSGRAATVLLRGNPRVTVGGSGQARGDSSGCMGDSVHETQTSLPLDKATADELPPAPTGASPSSRRPMTARHVHPCEVRDDRIAAVTTYRNGVGRRAPGPTRSRGTHAATLREEP